MNVNIDSIYWFMCDAAIFLTFFATCAMLTSWRFSIRKSLLISGGFLLGVTGINLFLALTGHPSMQILTLLPITAYLPMIICIHILSRASFFQTTAIWNIGLIGYFLQKFAVKLLKIVQIGASNELIALVGVVCTSVVMLFLLIKYIRKPIKQYILELEINWIVMWLPLLFISALFSYFSWSTLNVTVSLLLFLTALAIFLVLSIVLKSAYESMRLRQNEENLALQIDMQKHDYESVCKKIEIGRIYRHDMRHHFAALDTLLQQGKDEDALLYIHSLNDKFTQVEHEIYCENQAVNAILSFYAEQAKAADCPINIKVQIPKSLPFEEVDLCMIFSNALENAIHACEKISDSSKKMITVSSSYENGKMAISIDNTCLELIEFDRDGFPITLKREGHGIGLKSIESVAVKYNGFFSCSLAENVFSVKTVIFEKRNTPNMPKKPHKYIAKQTAVTSCFLVFTFCMFINVTPSVANALQDVPVIGDIVRVITLKSFQFRWGDTAMELPLPKVEAETPQEKTPVEVTQKPKDSPEPTFSTKPTAPAVTDLPKEEPQNDKKSNQPNTAKTAVSVSAGVPKVEIVLPEPIELSPPPKNSESLIPSSVDEETHEPEASVNPKLLDGVDEINHQMEDYVEQLRQEFIGYVSMKYQGYVGMDSEYTVLCNNDSMISIRFDTVINLGGTGNFSRIFTLDKRLGEVIELKSLFTDDSDYIKIISSEILEQMQQQVADETGDYFIPGGIWSDDVCFKAIEPDQNFYINDQGKLVIVFDEYTVAPGKMGCPEFVTPTQAIETLLIQPSLIII